MRVGQHQGYLARVDSARENRVILEALSAHLSDNQLAGTLANDGSEAPFAWLGGSDSASEGQWVCIAWVISQARLVGGSL